MHFVNAKGILSAHNGMNIYRGCTHGCIYCDSRSRCYHIDHPFEDIEVKQNAAELLDDALRRKKNRCMISTGSMCDPYLHCEGELRLTRRCLEVIERRGFGVSVLTKSDRILRDMDLYRRIHNKAKAVVQMTLTTYDVGRSALSRQQKAHALRQKGRGFQSVESGKAFHPHAVFPRYIAKPAAAPQHSYFQYATSFHPFLFP